MSITQRTLDIVPLYGQTANPITEALASIHESNEPYLPMPSQFHLLAPEGWKAELAYEHHRGE